MLLPEKVSHAETRAVRMLRRGYDRLRDAVLGHRHAAVAAGVGAVALVVLAGSTIGLEFLPKLEEGNMWIRAVMPASISLEAGNDYANRMRRLIKSFPEAETVISQHGRPDDGTRDLISLAVAIGRAAWGIASYANNESDEPPRAVVA